MMQTSADLEEANTGSNTHSKMCWYCRGFSGLHRGLTQKNLSAVKDVSVWRVEQAGIRQVKTTAGQESNRKISLQSFMSSCPGEKNTNMSVKGVCVRVCSRTNEMLLSKVRNTKWGRSELCLKTWSFLLSLINLKQQLSDNPPTVRDQSSEVLYWKPGFNTHPPRSVVEGRQVSVLSSLFWGDFQPAVWILLWSLTFRYKLLDIFDSIKYFPPLLKDEMADLLTLPWRSVTKLLGHY